MRYGDKVREKRLLKKIYEETKNQCRAGVYYSLRKERFVRFSCNDKKLRNQSDRKIRRLSIDEFIPNGKAYCKLFEYRWAIV